VYWNSRLQTEHARLVDSFKPTDVVVDGFAGVGPFAIPAGKKGCGVLASDLNPASAAALAENVKLNKVRAIPTSCSSTLATDGELSAGREERPRVRGRRAAFHPDLDPQDLERPLPALCPAHHFARGEAESAGRA
jgi:tRNA (guanine37-N1)-methyltransferase